MSVIAWIVVGVIAGALANLIYPAPSKGGIFGAMVLGIVGGLIGGFLMGLLSGEDAMTGFNITSIVVATLGALLLVFAFNALTGKQRHA